MIPDVKFEVSRRHAVIDFRDGAFFVTDTSRNGLSINGQVLGKGNSAQLHDGDRLVAGGFEICAAIQAEPTARAGSERPRDTARAEGSSGIPTTDEYSGLHVPEGEPWAHGPRAATEEMGAPASGSMPGQARHRDVLEVLERTDPFATPVEREPAFSSDSVSSDRRGPDAARKPALGVPVPPLAADSGADLATSKPRESGERRAPGAGEAADDSVSVGAAPVLPPDWKEGGATLGGETLPAADADLQAAVAPAAPPEPERQGASIAPARARGAGEWPDGPELVAALLRGADLPDYEINGADAAAVMENVGRVMRETVHGVRRVLIARSEVKETFRLSVTQLRPVENNPLKFSVSVEDALAKLLQPAPSGYLPPADSTREVFRDLEIHEIAVITGMRAALERIFSRFEPDELERRLERHFLDTLVPATRKAKLWELFTEHFQDIHREAKDAFDQLYGSEFADAYDKEIRALKLKLELERSHADS